VVAYHHGNREICEKFMKVQNFVFINIPPGTICVCGFNSILNKNHQNFWRIFEENKKEVINFEVINHNKKKYLHK
jgi:hypothetical protein